MPTLKFNETYTFPKKKLKKLHLQLKHGSHTQMVNWIKAAGKYHKSLDEHIKTVLQLCPSIKSKTSSQGKF